MFQYSLHSIPCIGFEVFFGGKSIAFTVRSDRPHTTLRSALQPQLRCSGRAAGVLESTVLLLAV
jgi:hypothetical protein